MLKLKHSLFSGVLLYFPLLIILQEALNQISCSPTRSPDNLSSETKSLKLHFIPILIIHHFIR